MLKIDEFLILSSWHDLESVIGFLKFKNIAWFVHRKEENLMQRTFHVAEE